MIIIKCIIIIHYTSDGISSKIIALKQQQSNFMVGGRQNMRNCTRRLQIRKVENHSFRAIQWLLKALEGECAQPGDLPHTFCSGAKRPSKHGHLIVRQEESSH